MSSQVNGSQQPLEVKYNQYRNLVSKNRNYLELPRQPE